MCGSSQGRESVPKEIKRRTKMKTSLKETLMPIPDHEVHDMLNFREEENKETKEQRDNFRNMKQ
jgi:hypothetical protein